MTDVKNDGMDRRNFLRSTAAVSAGLLWTPMALGEGGSKNVDDINIAMIGVGRQGKILLHLMLKVPGIQVKAVCDIWSYGQKMGKGLCRASKQTPTVYDDYKEMLANEKDLDAAIIAVPDFLHHELTNACLKAGLHVYCEKEMSNDLEKARSMVVTAKETGKLLQIGHQRRSNPYYKHTYTLMHKDKFFGDITTVNGQWHQQKPVYPLPAKLAEKYALPQAMLDKYGYRTMSEFYYWRWFERYAGGPMTDLGSHQVDIFNWFIGGPPTSVYAIGGVGHAIESAKANNAGYVPECFDHTLALYEWQGGHGKVRGYYQVNLTTSYGGFYEVFMGHKGSAVISEITSKHAMFKERSAEVFEWEDEADIFDVGGEQVMKFDPLKSRKAKGKMDAEGLKMEADMKKPAHQPHLENFFDTIRGEAELTCPGEVGFETCVSVLKANESAKTGKRLSFTPGEFTA